MAKILISPIGAGQPGEKGLGREYILTDYKIENNEKLYRTRFISEALAEYFKIDKIFFVGTNKSIWADLYEHFSNKNDAEIDENYWFQLVSNAVNYKYCTYKIISQLDNLMQMVDKYLRNKNPKATGGSSPIIIKYGKNQDELWQNFTTFMGIIDKINDKDEIYIDITNAFRSIPIFMYLMLEFIETLRYKNIRLVGMYYGMYDRDSKLEYTPVVNLKPLLDISKWIRGTHEFINFGSGYGISSLINSDKKSNSYNPELSASIRNLSELLNINYLIELREEIRKMDELYNNLGKESGALVHVLPLIRSFTERFTKFESDSDFQLEVSKWYFENKRYGHGYICLVEAILTKLCEVYKKNVKNLKDRDEIKSVLNLTNKYKHISDLKALKDIYDFVNPIRNKIAHASFMDNISKQSYKEDIKEANNKLEETKRLFKSTKINELDKKITYKEVQENYNRWKNNRRTAKSTRG